jgi:hypothetical protein
MAGLDTRQAGDLLAALQHDPKGKAILARSSADPLIVAIPNTTGNDLATLRTMRHTTSAAVLAAGAVPWINAAGSHMNDREQGAQRVVAEKPAWELNVTDGTSSQDALFSQKKACPGTGSRGTSITDAQRIEIVVLAKAGISRNKVCVQVFGSKGRNFDKVKAILDEAGL